MPKRRPNILFIITDQQYAGAMSCAGNPDVYTPNMDSLAETGVRFTRAYCTHPLCGPQRASFMTGLFPHQNGAISNNTPINPEYKGRTLGNLLANAGYDCALSGKWHVPGTTPEESGLEVICGSRDDEVPLRSIEFMQRDRDNPFFLFASFINPHDICQVARNQPLPQGPVPEPATVEECPSLPANFAIPPYAPDILQMLRQANRRVYPTIEYTEDDWRRLRFYYYRLCEKVDAEIGVLLNGLRDLGLEEETYIVFTSDHGDGHGAHQWNQKTSLYEEVINVPFIISHKGITRAGGVDNTHLVSLGLDLLPTLCDVGGASVPDGLEGLSLRPLAESDVPDEWRRELVVETIMGIAPGPGGSGASRAVLTDRYKYSAYPMGRYREQLVDLQTDPGEMVNLAVNARFKDELDDHRRRLRAWCERTEDEFLKFCL
ncbi:MAG: sulfatase-like hydrolase/transferase [Gemmatimonadetes bacterium]|nr:sulfatase-like hydrolase/transferase [Gemmatimonadota bacterium]